jgi:putative ABC transport system permease protein
VTQFVETIHDLRHGFRALLKRPAFSAVALLTLALGIGADTAMFSIINTVLLNGLPYPDSNRLVILDENRLNSSRTVSWMDFLDWRKQNRAFDDMAAYRLSHVNLTGVGEPALLRVGEVSSPFFKVLGIQPFSGRTFDEEEDSAGADPVVVISYQLWKTRLGGDPNFAGKTLTLDGVSYSIIGVLPPEFNFFDKRVDACLPVGLHGADDLWTQRGIHPDLLVLARLRAGTSLASARLEMVLIMRQLERSYPWSNSELTATVTSLYQYRYGSTQTILLALFGAVGCVLLIACVNVANLLLAQGSSRKKELAVRASLGADRWRLTRQLVTESLTLSLVGGCIGILLAVAGLNLIARVLPHDLPPLTEIKTDGTVLLFTLAVSLMTGLLFGTAPAMHAASGNLNPALTETGRGSSTSRTAKRLRSILLIAEIAIALVLVTTSGLMIRSMMNAVKVDPGFQVDHLLALDVVLSPTKYDREGDKSVFFTQAVQRLRALPGVHAASAAIFLPLTGHNDTAFMLADHAVESVVDLPTAASNVVVPGYFETLRVPLLQGRFFSDADTQNSRLVAVVNQSFARQHWPTESAIGKLLREGGPKGNQPYREIVGVVADLKQSGMDVRTRPEVFLPVTQFPFAPWTSLQAMTFVIRTKGDPLSISESAKKQLQATDKDLPVTAIRPMTEYMSESLERRKFCTLLFGTFAALALLLATIGTYGVMAHNVSQKTQEIGVRMAFGASAGRICRLVLGEALLLASAGIVIGWAGAVASTRWIASLLFRTQATDPAIFGFVAALLLIVALLASYIPMRRALSVDPASALRAE